MSYIGENNHFSFRDGYCESLPGISVGTSEAAKLGRVIADLFGRFSVGCDSFAHNHILYAISSGIAESGKDVYVCENTDLPSFRFAYPMLSAECGIYVTGESALKIYFYDKNGFPVNTATLEKIMIGPPALAAEKSGRITAATSFRSIYTGNIADSFGNMKLPISAGVSCGSRSVRSLWQEFFTGEDDSLVFQISDNGQRVNAYSVSEGFISHEKLILAYAAELSRQGQAAVWLPDDFHFAADMANKRICRFSMEKSIPEAAVSQRFLIDPLFMCAHLASDREKFISTVRELPAIFSVKREITVTVNEDIPFNKTIAENGGRIIIRKSGRSRLSLVAQACSAETAAEICSGWTEKLRRLSSGQNISDKKFELTDSQNY